MRIVPKLRATLVATALFVTMPAVSGCPKEDHGGTTGATPAQARASATPTSPADAGTMTGPSKLPGTGPTILNQPGPTATPPTGSETVIQYRWGGGLSIYQFYSLTIRSAATGDGADVVFVVKPAPKRGEQKTVTDTLDAAQFAELKALFDQVHFDSLNQAPRSVRIMDIGQTTISREGGGKAKKELVENGNNTVDGDLGPLRKWLDTRVRTYLDRSGAAPSTAPGTTATPKK